MEAGGLSEQDKEVLCSGNWNTICEFLGSEDTRPMLVRTGGGQPPGGGGD